jgi:hypothetical protein
LLIAADEARRIAANIAKLPEPLRGKIMAEALTLLPIYLAKCFERALRGSLTSAFNWAGILGLGIVAAVYQYRGVTITDPHTWSEVTIWGLAYIAIAWVIIFIIRLIFVAPFQTFKETEVQRLKLEKEIDDREIRQRTLNLIWDLREEGVKIRNEFPVNFPNWQRRAAEWRVQVFNAAGVLSTNLRRHLQTLNETHGYPSDIQIVGGSHDGDHKLELCVISEILRRLEKYLERDL